MVISILMVSSSVVCRDGRLVCWPWPGSEDGAPFALLLLFGQIGHGRDGPVMPRCGRWGVFSAGICWRLPLIADSDGDGRVENLLDAVLLFTTALHVHGAHLLGDGTALLRGHRREALCLEELDAALLVAEIGLEAKKHQWCCGAEVEDFGVPLKAG